MTDDTWDRWPSIKSHFLSAQHMQPYIAHPNGRYGLPSWPDLDMVRGTETLNRTPHTPGLVDDI